MNDPEPNSARTQAQHVPSLEPDSSHPLPMWPLAHTYPESGEAPATADAKAAGDEQKRDDAVGQLARALRIAKRAHGAYLNELRLGDVEPREDWPTWYAEYLLGLR